MMLFSVLFRKIAANMPVLYSPHKHTYSIPVAAISLQECLQQNHSSSENHALPDSNCFLICHQHNVTRCNTIHWECLQDLLLTEPDLAAGFQHTKFLVMDEADRLLEASFEPDLRAILTKLPAKRQTLLFSATMTRNLVALQKVVLHDAFHFQVTESSQLSAAYSPHCVFSCDRSLSCMQCHSASF